MMSGKVKHTVERQAFPEGVRLRHVITCTCGREIVNTLSLKESYDKADLHLELDDSDQPTRGQTDE